MITDDNNGGVLIDLRVQPGAGRNAVVGRHGDAIKVRVGAPPIGGRANEAIIDLIADTLGVKRAEVSLVSGDTSRTKRVQVNGITVELATSILVPDSTTGDRRG